MKSRWMIWICAVLLVAGCSKGSTEDTLGDNDGDDNPKNPGTPPVSWGTGTIYYTSPGEGVVALNLGAKTKKGLLPNSNSRHDWDISWDGSRIIESTLTTDNDYDSDLYITRKVSDGTFISQFKFVRPTTKYTWPRFSPNGAMVAVNSGSTTHGLYLLDNQGNIQRQLYTMNNQSLAQNIMTWAPDDTILVMVGNQLYRSDKSFLNADYITDIAIENRWGMPQVSPDGQKIAYATGGHIWVMDSNGSNKKKVTTSSTFESMPRFSPDSKHLLLGTNFVTPVTGLGGTGVFSDATFRLVIIPADGKEYNVDYGAHNRVVQIRMTGKDHNEIGAGSMVWR